MNKVFLFILIGGALTGWLIRRITVLMSLKIEKSGVSSDRAFIEGWLPVIVNILGWLCIVSYYGWSSHTAVGLFLFSFLLLLAMVDMKYYLIPNKLVIIFLLAGIMYRLYAVDLSMISVALGTIIGFLVPYGLFVFSKGGIGGGDVKLCTVMGIWVGFPSVLTAIFLGALLGSIVGLGLAMIQGKLKDVRLAFGPFLAAGFLIVFFQA